MSLQTRATQIVLESFEKGELPPDPFPLSTLSGAIRKPSLFEFQQVRDYEHLAKCAEEIYLEDEEHLKDEIQRQPDGTALWALWRERFHSSIYRVLLAGAVLYRAYQEPMYLAANWGLPNFLEKYVEELGSDDESSEPVGVDELYYLTSFAPYNLGDSGSVHGGFKSLAEFFVQQAKKRAYEQKLHGQNTEVPLPTFATPQGLSSSEAAVLFIELGQMLYALEVLVGIQDRESIIVNGNGSKEHGRTGIAPDLLSNPARTTAVVLFGNFFPEYISTPAVPADAVETHLVAAPVDRPLQARPGIVFQHINQFLYDLHKMAGRGNKFSSQIPAPYPHHKFFEYMFGQYLGLRFVDRELDMHYAEFSDDGFIFAERHDLIATSEFFTETDDVSALMALFEPVASTTGKT
jgi:hypothetical protein